MSRNVATVGTAAAAAVLLAATPALAGTDVTVYSTHSGCNLVACSYDAAKATFISNGDDWRVCDLASDGERAKASITYTNSNGSIVTHYTEATGGSGTCVNDGVGVDIPEGRRVTVKVWHQDGAGGTPRDVTTGYGTA